MPKGPYVFISYSTKDNEFVEKTVKLIRSMNVSFWKAPENIPSGSSYAQEIVNAIRNCSLFLVLLSDNSQNSMWVEKEIDCALSYERNILPLNIDDTPLRDTFRFYLNNVQMIFYPKDPEKAFSELKAKLSPLSVPETENSVITPSVSANTVNEVPKKAVFTDGDSSDDEPEETSAPPVPKFSRNMKMAGFTDLNRFPTVCQYCGSSPLKMIKKGIFQCIKCGQTDYDDFTSIRNYLDKKGPQQIPVIERELGIPRKIINDFWQRHGN